MKALYFLAVLVTAGYGTAWMIGGPQLANRFLSRLGRGLWFGIRWLAGAVVRFAGWVLSEVGGGIPRLVGGWFNRVGRRISP